MNKATILFGILGIIILLAGISYTYQKGVFDPRDTSVLERYRMSHDLVSEPPVGSSVDNSQSDVSGNTSGQPVAVNPNDVPRQVTITGTFTCLPHKDTSGPQTMECAFGLRETSGAGAYFAVDTSLLSPEQQTLFSTSQSEQVKVSGLLVPIEQISSNVWEKYNIKGIIQANAVVK